MDVNCNTCKKREVTSKNEEKKWVDDGVRTRDP